MSQAHTPLDTRYAELAAWSGVLYAKGFEHRNVDVADESGQIEQRTRFFRAHRGQVQILDIYPGLNSEAPVSVRAFTQDRKGGPLTSEKTFQSQDVSGAVAKGLAHVGAPLERRDRATMEKIGAVLTKAWSKVSAAITAAKQTPDQLLRSAAEFVQKRQAKLADRELQKKGWTRTKRKDLQVEGGTTYTRSTANGIRQTMVVMEHNPVKEDGIKYSASVATLYHGGAGKLESTVPIPGASGIAFAVKLASEEAAKEFNLARRAVSAKFVMHQVLEMRVRDPGALQLAIKPAPGGLIRIEVEEKNRPEVLMVMTVEPGKQLSFVQETIQGQFGLPQRVPLRDASKEAARDISFAETTFDRKLAPERIMPKMPTQDAQLGSQSTPQGWFAKLVATLDKIATPRGGYSIASTGTALDNRLQPIVVVRAKDHGR